MVERMLDSTWTRVEQFDAAGPSSRSAPIHSEAMQVDGQEDNDDAQDEWEYQDTEELVTLDLGPESKRLLQMSHQYSITGLETKNNVFLRLGNVMFKGHWDQLIGTEILLRDHKDSSKPIFSQHELSPLHATETDIRMGRAPSTTRHRIQFLPATNMLAREDALKEQGGGVSGQPLITHKGGWVWIRGKGWMRKEQFDALGIKDLEDAVNGAEQSASAPRLRALLVKKKVGRKKMTSEERMRYSIWKSLQKIDKNREGQEASEEGEDDQEEEEDEEVAGSGSNAEEEEEEAEDGSLLQGNGVS